MAALRSLKRRDFLRLASLAGLGLAVPLFRHSLGDSSNLDEVQMSTYALGTMITIRVERIVNLIGAQVAVNTAFQEIRRLESLFTRFHAMSQVGQLNIIGHIESPQPELVDIMSQSSHYSEKTEGAFDVTVKPALDLFENRRAGTFPPTDASFDAAKNLIDYEKVSVSAGAVSLAKPGMGITLDCLGKGYVLDRAAAILRAHGIDSALIDGGGTLVAVGSRSDGSAWRIGIMNPTNPNDSIGTIHLENGAVATSGDYENYFTPDLRYYHIIDPRTASSPIYSHSATVLAPSASEADPLALALMVKSPSEALSFIDQFAGCECLIITRNSGLVRSTGFGMT